MFLVIYTSFLDYRFFDVFHSEWCRQLFEAIGIRGSRPQLLKELSSNLVRYIKIGTVFSPGMHPHNGRGEWDGRSGTVSHCCDSAALANLDR